MKEGGNPVCGKRKEKQKRSWEVLICRAEFTLRRM